MSPGKHYFLRRNIIYDFNFAVSSPGGAAGALRSRPNKGRLFFPPEEASWQDGWPDGWRQRRPGALVVVVSSHFYDAGSVFGADLDRKGGSGDKSVFYG